MLMRGLKPLVTIYPQSGHVPHADAALPFAQDVIAFINAGHLVSVPEDPLSY
jgi:hypothetical protein